MERTNEPIVLTPGEAARRLVMSDSGLRAWRRSGKGPRFLRYGRAVRYLARDIEKFIEQCAVEPKPQKPPRQGGVR